MDNALIDDRRIHVDFSQSMHGLWKNFRKFGKKGGTEDDMANAANAKRGGGSSDWKSNNKTLEVKGGGSGRGYQYQTHHHHNNNNNNNNRKSYDHVDHHNRRGRDDDEDDDRERRRRKEKKKRDRSRVGREIAKNEERRKITINDGIEVAREIGKIGSIADDIRNLLHVLNSTRRGIAHTFLKQVVLVPKTTYASQSRDERRSALRKFTTFVVSIVVSFEIIFSHHAIANCIR